MSSMMVEHYDDDALVTLIERNSADKDAHLASCGDCRERVDSFRLVVDALHDDSTWDERPLNEAPVPETIANLRAFADQMASDDAQAEVWLRDLLDGPREGWMAKLREHPEYRTAGMVRKLIEATSHAIDTMPPDAVEITALATEIADHLDPASHTTDTVPRLRGAAYRERAYALFYTGAFSDAEAALLASESNFSDCAVEEYELARVGVVRALVMRMTEEVSQGLDSARTSARRFIKFGDVSRTASARLAEAHHLFTRGEFATAAHALERIERQLQESSDIDTHARVLANLGYCCWKLGRVDDALRHHDAAAAIFDVLGIHTESVRIRWNVACILASAARVTEAQRRFEVLLAEFRRLGMVSAEVLVSLDMAELLLARGEYPTVERICHAAMRSFEAAGIPYTARALTALAYINEAARQHTATPALAKHVRAYISRLPQDSNVLFAPPPV